MRVKIYLPAHLNDATPWVSYGGGWTRYQDEAWVMEWEHAINFIKSRRSFFLSDQNWIFTHAALFLEDGTRVPFGMCQ